MCVARTQNQVRVRAMPRPLPVQVPRRWRGRRSTSETCMTRTRTYTYVRARELSQQEEFKLKDGWEQLQVLLFYNMGLRALSDDRPARVRHGKDSAHPQQESGHHEPAGSARDRRLHRRVRKHVTFVP